MHVMEDVVLEICDPETGAPLPAGETGGDRLHASTIARIR